MNVLELFAGAGGGILGAQLLGHRVVCAVELDDYCQSVLLARQDDGTLRPFPIWDDVRTFDGRPWRGLVDIVSGGFPCQDISSAGKRAGIEGKRSGLWSEMARVVCEIRPRYVFVENVPGLTVRGLDRVLGDLAALGYDAVWDVLGAHHVGAPHKRDRLWILAYANDGAQHVQPVDAEMACPPAAVADTLGQRGVARDSHETIRARGAAAVRGPEWPTEPGVDRVADGVAHGVDRNRALGNGQVPAVHALAWRTLMAQLQGSPG